VTVHVALLRGINVGGHKPVAMADLRALVARLGFADVRSVLQSGNLVFRGAGAGGAGLERMLAEAARTHLGLEADFFVRTAREWRAIVRRNPFPAVGARDPAHLLVMVLRDAPPAAALRALHAAITGAEVVRARGRELYVVYPDGIGRSRFTGALVERTLGTRGTARNWNTVLRLGALIAA
jgi:uncharacterized protein (DUF1697 family)